MLAGWGCGNHRYPISRSSPRGKPLNLVLAAKAMPPGTDCVMRARPYGSLVVSRSQLRGRYAIATEALVAGA